VLFLQLCRQLILELEQQYHRYEFELSGADRYDWLLALD
jgi:hypothetical protein